MGFADVFANAFLATKISFTNVVSDARENTDNRSTQLADFFGCDERIEHRFFAVGLGFDGRCFT